MERRSFLGVVGAGLFAPALPIWLRAGFQDADEGGRSAARTNPFIQRSLERSRGLGKPTLVFVVSPERDEWYRRQRIFGQFLTHCSHKALLDLSLCEVLCARQASLAARVPAAKEPEAPLLMLLEPDGSVRSAPDELPEVAAAPGLFTPPGSPYEKTVHRRVRALAEGVRALLLPDEGALAARAEAVKEALGSEKSVAVVSAFLNGTDLHPTVADEAGAWIRARHASSGEGRSLLFRVAEGVGWRLRTGPPFGAEWMKSLGCGGRSEPIPKNHPLAPGGEFPRSVGSPCGMAFIPKVSQRFLRFWGSPSSGH